MKHKILTRDDILKLVESEGETALRRFVEARRKRKNIDPSVMDFLTDSFTKILKGEDAAKALKLEKKRGRKKTLNEFSRKVEAAEEVIRNMRTGKRYEESVSLAAVKLGKSEKTVKRHYAAAKRMLGSHEALSEFYRKFDIQAQLLEPIEKIDTAISIIRKKQPRTDKK